MAGPRAERGGGPAGGLTSGKSSPQPGTAHRQASKRRREEGRGRKRRDTTDGCRVLGEIESERRERERRGEEGGGDRPHERDTWESVRPARRL